MSKAIARIFVCLSVVLGFSFATSAFAQTIFTSGNLVVSVEGCGVQGGTCTSVPNGTGNGTGNSSVGGYGDNQAAPFTLFQFQLNSSDPTTLPATFVNSLVLPQTTSGANVPVSGEYGSSSEGMLQLAGTDQYLTIMGYGVNANAFNADPTLYDIPGGELGQSGSLTGQSYTPVPRVVTLIDPYGNINSSNALLNIFNANNPRSTYTADGINIYVSGQGTSGDSTGGVFYTTFGSGSTTAITGDDSGGTVAQDTRDVQIYNNTLYVSMDSKEGSYNRSYIGTLGTPPATSVYSCGSGCPTGDGTIGPALMSGFGNTGGTGRVKLTAAETNGINVANEYINLSPENYFFASPTVLYVADSGSPKNTSADNETTYSLCGAGGLQKWVNVSGTWTWEYTLYQGLNLVQNANTGCSSNTSGTTGLIGLTGVVSGGNVYLYATNYTIADLDPTYLYGITDVLSATTNPGGESFTQLAAAPADSNFKGVAFAPTLPAGSATITSSPSGLAFTSTGTGCAPGTYTTPVTLIWTPGVSCALSVASPQSASGAQYTLAHWQDGTTNTTDTVTAPTSSAVYTASFTTTTSIAVTNVSPAAEDYGLDSPVTITALLSWNGIGPAPTASDVTIGGNGPSSYGTTSCGTPSGTTMTCTNTYTPTSSDGPGSYTESATFAGDSNYSASSSTQTNNFTINQASASTIVTSSLNPSVFGQSVTFTATISGENGQVKGRAGKQGVRQQIVTGSVTWSANTGCGSTPVTSGNPGVATCTTSSLGVGTEAITATYSGDGNHGGNTGTLSGGQGVNQATTSIAVTSVSPAAEDYGLDSPVTITAVLSWTGSGAAPTATAVSIGGNGPSSYGTTICAAPSGTTMICTNTYSPTTADTPGAYTESAAFAGDSNYSASSSTQTNNFTINQASASAVVTSSLNPTVFGQSVTFTATISGENGQVKGRMGKQGVKQGVKQQTITGSVTWSANTGCGSTPVTSGNPGVATCTTSSLGAGTDAITATYSGDGNHSGSIGTLSGGQVVNQATPSITWSNPAAITYGTQLSATQLDAKANVPGSFAYSPAAGSVPNAGSQTLSVTFTPSDAVDYASASDSVTLQVNPATQKIVFSILAPSTAAYNTSFTVAASASSNLPVVYSAEGSCTNSGATYTITSGSGLCTVKVNQSGNNNYLAAPTVTGFTTAIRATPTVSFTGAPASAPYNNTFTLLASTNSTAVAVITATNPNTCALSGSSSPVNVTMLGDAGMCKFTATWAADPNYNSATATQTTTAAKATSSVTWATPAAITYGTALGSAQLDASGTPAAGTYTYTPASGAIEEAGTVNLKVTFTPTNTDYSNSTATVALQVLQAATTTAITSPSSTITMNADGVASATLHFNVTSYKPTGAVTLTANTGEVCSGMVSMGTGSGSCTLTFTTTGTRTITASYGGDANHTGSNSDAQNPAITVTVNPHN